jgi:hypothetical protein
VCEQQAHHLHSLGRVRYGDTSASTQLQHQDGSKYHNGFVYPFQHILLTNDSASKHQREVPTGRVSDRFASRMINTMRSRSLRQRAHLQRPVYMFLCARSQQNACCSQNCEQVALGKLCQRWLRKAVQDQIMAPAQCLVQKGVKVIKKRNPVVQIPLFSRHPHVSESCGVETEAVQHTEHGTRQGTGQQKYHYKQLIVTIKTTGCLVVVSLAEYEESTFSKSQLQSSRTSYMQVSSCSMILACNLAMENGCIQCFVQMSGTQPE